MEFRRKSVGSPLEVGRIPTVTETERRRNGQDKTAAPPRPDRKILRLESEPSPSCARSEGGPPEKIRDLVQIRVAHLGPANVRMAMQLLNGWWRAGYRSEPHLLALVDWFIERHVEIRVPFAYFNAKSAAFRDMHESISSRLSESEGARLKKLDKRREELRAARLWETRNPVEGEAP